MIFDEMMSEIISELGIEAFLKEFAKKEASSNGTENVDDASGNSEYNLDYSYILTRAIATYGARTQIDMAIEEMSELTKALCKERRAIGDPEARKTARWNVIDEIADVAIMLQQLNMIFDCEFEVSKVIEYKLKRLEKRLDEHDEHTRRPFTS